MAQLLEADLVVLKKVKRLASDFHRHMAMSQMKGSPVKSGDRVLVYEVDNTYPNGTVMVTERTIFEFC